MKTTSKGTSKRASGAAGDQTVSRETFGDDLPAAVDAHVIACALLAALESRDQRDDGAVRDARALVRLTAGLAEAAVPGAIGALEMVGMSRVGRALVRETRERVRRSAKEAA